MVYTRHSILISLLAMALTTAVQLNFGNKAPIFSKIVEREGDEDEIAVLCQMVGGWGGGCTDYSQGFVVGLGNMALGATDAINKVNPDALIQVPGEDIAGDIRNEADCMIHTDKKSCASATTRDGASCYWCDHTDSNDWDDKYEQYFSTGTCFLNQFYAGPVCSNIVQIAFKPMMEEFSPNTDIPTAAEQGTCIGLTGDDDACNQNPLCSTCTVPDVYDWRWNNVTTDGFTTICYSKAFLHPEEATGRKGWCEKLTEVPAYATNKLILPSTTTTTQKSVSTTTTMATKENDSTTSTNTTATTMTADASSTSGTTTTTEGTTSSASPLVLTASVISLVVLLS